MRTSRFGPIKPLMVVALFLGVLVSSPVPAGAAASSLGGVTFAQPGKVRLIAGDLTTVSGTASADMVGKVVGLQLKVSGQWTTVTQMTVKPNRTFSTSVRMAGPGQVSYRLAAWTGTKWLQVEKNLSTWKWYPLVSQSAVDELGCRQIDNVTVAGTNFGRQLGTNGCWGISWSDFNLGFKCSVFSTDMGMRDDSRTGTQAIFDVSVDGAVINGARRTLIPGQRNSFFAEITGGFRLRLTNEVNLLRGYAAWPNAKVLCSAQP